jgi:hypothetical protein
MGEIANVAAMEADVLELPVAEGRELPFRLALLVSSVQATQHSDERAG